MLVATRFSCLLFNIVTVDSLSLYIFSRPPSRPLRSTYFSTVESIRDRGERKNIFESKSDKKTLVEPLFLRFKVVYWTQEKTRLNWI